MEISQTGFKYEVRRLEITDSTNNYLRPIALNPDIDFLYITAEYQTAGKGQSGNHWESESFTAISAATDGGSGCVPGVATTTL